MTEKPKDPRTVTLRGVRLSFTDAIYEKKASSKENPDRKTHHLNIIDETDGKYSAENRAKIQAAIRAAGEKQWKNPDAHKEIAEDNPKRVTWRPGHRFKNAEGKVYAGYEGNMAFSAAGPNGGARRPILKDRYKRTLRSQAKQDDINAGRIFEEASIPEIFYGGSYGDVIVSFYGTDKGSRGIFATCELIRSYQEGERMGGGFVVDDSYIDELEDFEDDDGLGGADTDGLLG